MPPQLREVAMDLNNRLNQLNSRINGEGQSGEAGMKAEMTEQDKFIATDIEMKDIEKDTHNVETSGSDSSSSRSRHPTDQAGKVEKINCNGPGDGREDEMAEASQHEEKQQRKRKRTIMNEKQISLMEKALMDEPDMQRNKASLEFWAKELSVHVCCKPHVDSFFRSFSQLIFFLPNKFLLYFQGSEVTKSQLKNW